jgi:P pilus assembly chaperone PapD
MEPGVFKKLKLVNIIILIYFLAAGDVILAQGDLLITPRRLVFEGSTRTVDMNLANTGKDTATYAISLVQMRMTRDGRFETITEPDTGQLFADKYLRFFPRSVTLGPNESQTVKVQLLRASQMSPGEYRSHFYFRAIPKPVALGENIPVADSNSISIVLKPIFGLTIPAIIRVGDVMAKVTLTDLNLRLLNDGVPTFSLTINRTGSSSVFGDLTVYYTPSQGKETRVGIANGIAVYTPNVKRTFQFNLNNVPGVDYTSGTLRAVFSAPTDVKPERYAEAEVALN